VEAAAAFGFFLGLADWLQFRHTQIGIDRGESSSGQVTGIADDPHRDGGPGRNLFMVQVARTGRWR
jgi:hypothetical protein